MFVKLINMYTLILEFLDVLINLGVQIRKGDIELIGFSGTGRRDVMGTSPSVALTVSNLVLWMEDGDWIHKIKTPKTSLCYWTFRK